MKNKIAHEIFRQLSCMSETELMHVSGQIMELISNTKYTSTATIDTYIKELDNYKEPVCKTCGSHEIVKYGKDRNGNQRYICRDCGKTFTLSTDTVITNTKKPILTWKNFIISTIKGLSLAKSAEACDISVPTAFAWRHKIFHAMNLPQAEVVFDGVVEMDETFINVSYKGNHKNSKTFTMPRQSFRRGTDNHPKSQDDRACVFCAVERGKRVWGAVPFCGLINVDRLTSLLDHRINDDTIVITDESHVFKRYLQDNQITNIHLKGAKGSGATKVPPCTQGAYHLNNINSLHHRLRNFLLRYNGVSTKYLNNYVAFFVWMENNKKKQALERRGEKELIRDNSNLTVKNLLMWPAKPDLAVAA